MRVTCCETAADIQTSTEAGVWDGRSRCGSGWDASLWICKRIGTRYSEMSLGEKAEQLQNGQKVHQKVTWLFHCQCGGGQTLSRMSEKGFYNHWLKDKLFWSSWEMKNVRFFCCCCSCTTCCEVVTICHFCRTLYKNIHRIHWRWKLLSLCNHNVHTTDRLAG